MIPLIGCCGWSGRQSDYFSEFPAIEIQSTFYQPPALKTAERWHSEAPGGFRFCMKAWQLITHTPSSPTYRRLRLPVRPADRELLGSFRDSEQVWRAWETTRSIAEAVQTAVVVFQCPASFLPTPVNIKNFSRFFERVGSQPFRLAWEPRGPAWPAGLTRELCSSLNLIHCVDPFVNQQVHGDALYWRLHGKGGFSYQYTGEDFRELRNMLLQEAEGGKSWVMFNNVPMKEDARRLRDFLLDSD